MAEGRKSRGHKRHIADEKKEFARKLRREPTPSQQLLWQEIRSDKLGWRFRRRALLYGWIVDFWCPAARLAIEIDHSSDVARIEEHEHRDAVLADYGIQVFRIAAARVFQETAAVLLELKSELDKRGTKN